MSAIYLAARYSRREELSAYRAILEGAGHTVTSRWLLSDHQLTDADMKGDGFADEKQTRFAVEDWYDVMAADTVISFTEPPRTMNNSRGGRHVEFGAALAAGKRCIIIGPRENVFHWMPRVLVYETFDDFLRAPLSMHWMASHR